MKRLLCCDYALIIIGTILVILGILGLALFPSLYESIVVSQLQLTRNRDDDSLGFSALLFSKPPMNNEMKFFFFNITNSEEMVYNGEAPRVNEVGPYTFQEIERKRYLRFNEDDTQLFYQNYKTWVFKRELSCDTCEYNDKITIPNAPQVGGAAGLLDPRYGVTPMGRFIIGIGLIILGEYPINSPSIGDLLFDGYNDPLLSAAHSPIIDIISTIFNHGVNIIPIPVPAMPKMAYFHGYNNSKDEEYWVRTGKDGVENLGQIVTWANQSLLPESWWTTKEARMINGTDTGSFARNHLTPEDEIQMFHSYICRSFTAKYVGKRDVEGIPSLTYSVLADDWDTTLAKNKGFRYPNYEKQRYFPNWPHCPRYNASNCLARTEEPIDCTIAENLCDDCCFKGYAGGTWITPPGIFPLVCYPGRLQPSPFAVMWSPPHFLYSPKEVTRSVVGLNPVEGRHNPMVYDHEPYSGMITQVAYRVQISMPIFGNELVIQNQHLPQSIIPVFYEDSHMKLAEFAYSYYRLGFVLAPKLAMGVSIAMLVLGLILYIAAVIKYNRKSKGD